ncbi:ragulator complex protein LAMTOR3-like isoform X2 [Ornithodoros turicata]|uniref:ragulator complex protein LAMTOR3-like isoform X2 n=1 Tax=Ornithodoros turicata TaxID=34597 RepID=UPI0031399655
MADELRKHLLGVMSRTPGLHAIIITDRDGVPLLKASNEGAPEHAMRPGFLSTMGMAMSQANKLGLGRCNKMISSYGNYQVISINQQPLTLTFLASNGANTGMILNHERDLEPILHGLRNVVETS